MATVAGGGDGWASVLTSDKYVLFIVTTTERVRPAQPAIQSVLIGGQSIILYRELLSALHGNVSLPSDSIQSILGK